MFVKILVLGLFLVAVVSTAAVDKDPVPIISQENDVDPSGSYHYSYESGDGTKVQQNGQLKTVDKNSTGMAITGDFEFQGDDGKTYKMSYVADENGYQPKGDHLPVSMEIPPLIQRALSYLATASPPKEKN